MAAVQLQKPTGRGNTFKGTEGIYLLPHHPNELERVKLCHGLMMSDTGNVLIKSPLPAAGSTIRVLDSGCADGTWLHDLSKLLPAYNWNLHGVDIHEDIFPSPERAFVPLDLRKHDINTEFPATWNWQNSFDIVHQRLLIWGIKTENWPAAIQRLLRLVKPGGWIELVEVVWVDNNIPIDANAQPELAKQRVLECWTCDYHGFDIQVATKLEGLLKNAGCANVTKYEYDLGIGAKANQEEWKAPSAEMWDEIFRSFEHKMPLEGIPGVAKTPEQLHVFLDKLNVEIKEHGYMPKVNFVIGQKPA